MMVTVFDKAFDLRNPDVRYLICEIARLRAELAAARELTRENGDGSPSPTFTREREPLL